MKRALASLTAVVAWVAITVQMVFSIRHALVAGETLSAAIHGFFSYFTAVTNVFVALVLTLPSFAPHGRLGRWFADPRITTTAAVSIVVVGVVYHVLLSDAYNPVGIEFVTDFGLHYCVPALYTAYWFWFAPKSGLRYAHIPTLLFYPLGYAIHTFVRGALTGNYPYFFLDVDQLGLPTVAVNVGGMLVVFVVVASLLLLATTGQRKIVAIRATGIGLS